MVLRSDVVGAIVAAATARMLDQRGGKWKVARCVGNAAAARRGEGRAGGHGIGAQDLGKGIVKSRRAGGGGGGGRDDVGFQMHSRGE